jgi:hypothetical protein
MSVEMINKRNLVFHVDNEAKPLQVHNVEPRDVQLLDEGSAGILKSSSSISLQANKEKTFMHVLRGIMLIKVVVSNHADG